jgi:hypothetical protein
MEDGSNCTEPGGEEERRQKRAKNARSWVVIMPPILSIPTIRWSFDPRISFLRRVLFA